ncbi:hypothetical protein BJV82DRAFT_585169 [Fennellomyces sp. T-0311]|nr:hypothetical protein BJV82DRAFT_585169 [Fennellomyces sp. T-0311]
MLILHTLQVMHTHVLTITIIVFLIQTVKFMFFLRFIKELYLMRWRDSIVADYLDPDGSCDLIKDSDLDGFDDVDPALVSPRTLSNMMQWTLQTHITKSSVLRKYTKVRTSLEIHKSNLSQNIDVLSKQCQTATSTFQTITAVNSQCQRAIQSIVSFFALHPFFSDLTSGDLIKDADLDGYNDFDHALFSPQTFTSMMRWNVRTHLIKRPVRHYTRMRTALKTRLTNLSRQFEMLYSEYQAIVTISRACSRCQKVIWPTVSFFAYYFWTLLGYADVQVEFDSNSSCDPIENGDVVGFEDIDPALLSPRTFTSTMHWSFQTHKSKVSRKFTKLRKKCKKGTKALLWIQTMDTIFSYPGKVLAIVDSWYRRAIRSFVSFSVFLCLFLFI